MRIITTLLLFTSILAFTNTVNANWAQILEDCGGHENHFNQEDEEPYVLPSENKMTTKPNKEEKLNEKVIPVDNKTNNQQG